MFDVIWSIIVDQFIRISNTVCNICSEIGPDLGWISFVTRIPAGRLTGRWWRVRDMIDIIHIFSRDPDILCGKTVESNGLHCGDMIGTSLWSIPRSPHRYLPGFQVLRVLLPLLYYTTILCRPWPLIETVVVNISIISVRSNGKPKLIILSRPKQIVTWTSIQ